MKEEIGTRLVTFRLPVSVLNDVEMIAVVEKRTRSNMLRVLVEDGMKGSRETILKTIREAK